MHFDQCPINQSIDLVQTNQSIHTANQMNSFQIKKTLCNTKTKVNIKSKIESKVESPKTVQSKIAAIKHVSNKMSDTFHIKS